MTFWQVVRKFPSIPLTSMALTIILVRRNGTCVSSHLSGCSQQHLRLRQRAFLR